MGISFNRSLFQERTGCKLMTGRKKGFVELIQGSLPWSQSCQPIRMASLVAMKQACSHPSRQRQLLFSKSKANFNTVRCLNDGIHTYRCHQAVDAYSWQKLSTHWTSSDYFPVHSFPQHTAQNCSYAVTQHSTTGVRSSLEMIELTWEDACELHANMCQSMKSIWAPTEQGSDISFLWIPQDNPTMWQSSLILSPHRVSRNLAHRQLKPCEKCDPSLFSKEDQGVSESDFCSFWVILHGWAYNIESPLGPSSPWHRVTITVTLLLSAALGRKLDLSENILLISRDFPKSYLLYALELVCLSIQLLALFLLPTLGFVGKGSHHKHIGVQA